VLAGSGVEGERYALGLPAVHGPARSAAAPFLPPSAFLRAAFLALFGDCVS